MATSGDFKLAIDTLRLRRRIGAGRQRLSLIVAVYRSAPQV